jgi:Flp pilus assembly pilin Flp
VDFINTQIVKAQNLLSEAKVALAARRQGQAMVEYGLILVLVSVVAVVGLTAIGGDLYSANPPVTGSNPGVLTAAAPVFNKIISALTSGAKVA